MQVETLTLQKDGVVGSFYAPAHSTGLPLIVVTGSDGGLANAQYIAQLFAQKGIAALAVAYFKYPGLSKTLTLIPLEYLENAITWLTHRLQTDTVGLYGVSKGAEYALCAAARFSAVARVVAVVPNYYVSEGKGRGVARPGVSSWSFRGKALPYTPVPGPLRVFLRNSLRARGMAVAPFYEQAQQRGILPASVIPVAHCHADLLLLTAGHDSVWPSPYAGQQMVQTLTAAGYPHRFRQVQFQQASHILNPVPPQKEKLLRLLFAQERQFATGCRAARQVAFRLATAWVTDAGE